MGVVWPCSRTFGLATRKWIWLCGNPGVTWEPVPVILLYADWLVAHEDSVISQPRIAVLGLSQLYVFMCLDDWSLVVVVLGFELYLQFKLRFKPSVYLYLRTSTKTRIAILVFFNHYSFQTRLLSFACQEALSASVTTRGAKCLRTLCSYQSVLVLSQPSDVAI